MLPQSKPVFGQYNSFAGIDKTNCKRLSLCPPLLIIAGHDIKKATAFIAMAFIYDDIQIIQL